MKIPFMFGGGRCGKIGRLERKVDIIMGKIEDLEAVLDGIPPVIAKIAADEAVLADEIKALKDQVAAGSAATEAQLQSALDKANAIKTSLDTVDATVPEPVIP